MLSRIVVEIDADLKKEAQIKALQNDTSLKEIIIDSLNMYLKESEKVQGNNDIKID